MIRDGSKAPVSVLFVALALTVVGCGGNETAQSSPEGGGEEGPRAETQPAAGPLPADIVVTRDGATVPDGCSPERTAGLVAGFFRAFNAGDGPELRRTFAYRGASPPLYGVGTGGNARGDFGTVRREQLLRYFAGRHVRGERLRLLQIEVRPSGREGAADVAYLVARSADDLGSTLGDAPKLEPGAYLYVGKGVIDCGTRRILAWNMDVADETPRGDEAGAERLREMGPCPAPTKRQPRDAILACSS